MLLGGFYQTGSDFCRFLFVLQMHRPIGKMERCQIVPAFREVSGLWTQNDGTVATAFIFDILHTKPAQGAAPAAFGIGFIFGQQLLIDLQRLAEFPGAPEIIAAVVGGGVLLIGILWQRHHCPAACAGAQVVFRERRNISAAVFAF